MVSSGLVERIDVSHYRLAIHLVTAFIILSIVYWQFLKLSSSSNQTVSINLFIVKIFLVLLFLQLIIGAFVSGMDAGKIYNTWPLMGVNYFPDDSSFKDFLNLNVFDNPSIVQFIHRNLAYLIIVFYALILLKVINSGNKKLYKPITLIGLILVFQIFLGVITILSGVKMLFASLHQINSILIILSTLYFIFISQYKREIN